MKKKLKLKKSVKLIITFIIILIISFFCYTKIHENYLYKQTYEYKLTEVGYSSTEIKLLTNNLKNEQIDKLLTENKNKTLIKILSHKNYKKDNLERYLNYIQNNDKDVDDTIKIVNLNHDYDYYELTLKVDTTNPTHMLVNKYYILDSSYVPDDLVDIPRTYSWGDDNQISKVCYEAFIDMHNDAKKDGHYLMINSGYRSYKDQEEVYNNYKELKGEKYADSIAARPGSSEHQTGLALDIFEKDHSSSATFKDSEAYTWLKENAHNYGFILRFPEGSEDITGYSAESWHYRYVGKELANTIYNLNITFDEYYANKNV